MSSASLIANSNQTAAIYRAVESYDSKGRSVGTNNALIANNVKILVQVSRSGLQSAERGVIISQGYLGYFLLGTNVQKNDIVRVTDNITGETFNYKVIGRDPGAVAPVQDHMEFNLEYDEGSDITGS